MNAHPFHDRRAIRAYNETQRDAIYATEREAIQREPEAPEPCNFCAPDELVPTTGLRAYLAKSLGRWWLLWLVAFSGLCVIAVLAFVALIYVSVAP